MSVAIACIVLLFLFILNTPIFISVLVAILIYFFMAGDISPLIAIQRIIGAGENVTLLAIPFFILLGNLLNYTGITHRMLKFTGVLSGHYPGGLAQSNVLLSTMMGGLSASNLADCAMLSKMLVPEMTKLGYSKGFSTAVTAAGSLITPIIPPGIALIIYGFVADVSIGKMFMAAIIPGLLCCVALMTAIYLISKKRGYLPARSHGPTVRELWEAGKGATSALVLILVIIGGIRFGIFTPTEAGAIAVLFVIIVGTLFYREMTLKDIVASVLETARSTASVMLIIMTCSALAWILTNEQIAQNVAVLMTGFSDNPYLFLLIVNAVLLFLGMFIEGNAAIIVLVPLLMPTVKMLGIDPIQFGVMMILNLAVGCLTPPMGTVMFVATSITGTKISEFIREVIPLFIALLVVLLMVTFIPALTTFLPSL
ncbi:MULTISPECIES: TRAP transporter large permease [Citrobacter]|jgi:tripartite ATP-independent transporter DctM subunit|uniref:TRAP transporter large permease protein n=1 Tax=Citrobacter braakii TaxID=57706 RepID=A0A1V8NYB4_CITBR|nr:MULTISPECIES: TRAP transporter large permease [Citrobacter]EGT0645066.1 TRAP transporter large permease [Citrobacter braakii]EHG7887603.1 TRAP transporter large permease [Citrobacter braakii]ELN2654785.1 TRAP transporter large permease [Citrobacter braakii]MBS6003571.1 TRAP transporter large permease [Citrobacter sp.]MCS8551917.1 TRAP transporter large permease [Citrobacter sp. XY323]